MFNARFLLSCFFCFFFVSALVALGCQHQKTDIVSAEPAVVPAGTIVRKDPRFDKLIPPASQLETLAGGFKWSEGPVWVKDGSYLLFSDIPNNAVMKWNEADGVSFYLKPSGYTGTAIRGGEPGSNGLLLDTQGRLVLCEHGDRRVARLEKDGKKTTLADRWEGKRLNSPNDAVSKSNGDLYFTDPPYGLELNAADPAKELPFQGVFRIAVNGELALLSREITRPNGIGFSPDEKRLYVANSDPKQAVWFVFDVKVDGTLENQRVFFDATDWLRAGKLGLPDGLKVDSEGNVWATGPGGVHVFAADGTHLGQIDTGEPTANCAFGGDGSTLYITANTHLFRIRSGARGLGFAQESLKR